MNEVTTFYVDYDDAREEYEVHAPYIGLEDKKAKRREFQFRCSKQTLEKLAKDVLSKHLDLCPACGGQDVSNEYQYRATSDPNLTVEYLDGYLLRTCQKCNFGWRAEPLWKDGNEN